MTAATKWIVAIVGLLVANLIAMVVLVSAARTNSSQVIPAYYERAVKYDDAIDQAAKNRELGWTVSARWDGRFVADVRDREGRPLADARIAIDSAARTPGQTRGLHDLTITVERGGDRFVQRATVEAQ